MSQPTTLIAELIALPGHEDVVADMLRELQDSVLAEPGSVLFEPARAPQHPRRFLVFERYRDHGAFVEHLESSHSASFNRSIEEHLEGGHSELTMLESL